MQGVGVGVGAVGECVKEYSGCGEYGLRMSKWSEAAEGCGTSGIGRCG